MLVRMPREWNDESRCLSSLDHAKGVFTEMSVIIRTATVPYVTEVIFALETRCRLKVARHVDLVDRDGNAADIVLLSELLRQVAGHQLSTDAGRGAEVCLSGFSSLGGHACAKSSKLATS